MRLALLCATALSTIFASSTADKDATANWFTVQRPGGGFVIKMPSRPSFEKRPIIDDGHQIMMYKYRAARGSESYQFVQGDVGPILPAGQEDYLLRNILDGLARANHASISSNELINFQGNAARMVVMKDAHGWQWAAFILWDGSHEDIVTYRAPAFQMSQGGAKEFFDTFKLLPY